MAPRLTAAQREQARRVRRHQRRAAMYVARMTEATQNGTAVDRLTYACEYLRAVARDVDPRRVDQWAKTIVAMAEKGPDKAEKGPDK